MMADDAPVYKQKVCPECGADMMTLNPAAHALSHYPEVLDPARSSKEARKRQYQILHGGVTAAEYNAVHEGNG